MTDATITFPLLGEDFKLNPSSSFTLFGREFYWYAVIIAVGFLLAALYIFKSAKRFGLTQDNMIDMLMCGVIAGVVGARLYYVVFDFEAFRCDTFLDTLWECCKIWEGGLAIYGGVIGGAVAICIYCWIKKRSPLPFLDIASLGLLIGQAVGRWGNFINREAYGYSGVNVEVPWKMGLKLSGQAPIYVHPTFLYESLWNIIGFLLIHFYSKKKRKYDGQVFLMYITWYGLGRTLIEGLRADSLMFGEVRVSQLFASITFVVGAVLLLINWVRGRDPQAMLVNQIAISEGTEELDVDLEDMESEKTDESSEEETILSNDENEEISEESENASEEISKE